MGWVRSCPGLFLQKALAELNGTFAWFTEQDQAFGYLGITKAQAHFLQKPDFLIKSISWEFGSLFLISDIPVIKARIQLLAAPPPYSTQSKGPCVQSFRAFGNQVFQFAQVKAAEHAFALGFLHLLPTLTLLLLAGKPRMLILPLRP